MRRDVYAAIALLIAIVAAATLYTIASSGNNKTHEIYQKEEQRGLLIVVTFPNLAYDVKQLVCEDDEVTALAPPGADPHNFQLTPRLVELAKRANIIISTAHAPFEIKLREIVDKQHLVEIPSIPGIRIFKNPVTGQPNYHMPIYDPYNYKAFITYLAEKLEQLRPECSNKYQRKANKVLGEIDKILESAPHMNLKAVGSVPPVQYAVEWLGIDVVWLLAPEHGVAPTPETLNRAKQLLDEGAVAVVMKTSKGLATSTDAKLSELAREDKRPVIHVPPPFAPGSIPEKLRLVLEDAKAVAKEG